MTDTSREAVERLLDGVTPGPWYRDAWYIRSDGPGTGSICEIARPNGYDDQYWKDGEADANASFIAAARELVPALLKERDALRADLTAALQRELMQMQRADEAEAKLAKAAACIVEAMIAPEALMIAGKPLGMTNGTWEQMVRSVGHARAALAEIKGERHG